MLSSRRTCFRRHVRRKIIRRASDGTGREISYPVVRTYSGRMNVSVNTVCSYTIRIYEKLHVHFISKALRRSRIID
jgi:hypothetical protein